MTKRCHFVRVSINPDINLGTAALFRELKYTIMFYCEPINICFLLAMTLFRSLLIIKINWFAMITVWSKPYPGSCCYYDHNSRACSRQEIFTMLLDWYAYYHT